MVAKMNSNSLIPTLDAAPRLSICIATYNRGKFIGETLDSILAQMVQGVELLVVDGASPDNTLQVMARYVESYPDIRYYREQENSGIDRDYDKAVGYAKGEYCWLMSDDDLVRPGAIQKVLSTLESGTDLIVVNAEVRNVDFSELLLEKRMSINSDLQYGKHDQEKFFVDTAIHLGFIGAVIIKREFWLSRDRASYFGTLFVHMGVIFQHPTISAANVIAEPCITIRDGNATWSARTFEVWAMKWPELIWSFPDFSDKAKQAVSPPEQWRRFKFLFYLRAMGAYSINEFNKHLSLKLSGFGWIKARAIAICPGRFANFVVVLYYVILSRSTRLPLYDVLLSRFAAWPSRFLVNISGLAKSK